MNAAWSIAMSLTDLGSTAASSALVSTPSSSVLSNRCASGHEPRSGSKPSTLARVCCAALSCDRPSVAACDGFGGGAVAAPSASMRARRVRSGSNISSPNAPCWRRPGDPETKLRVRKVTLLHSKTGGAGGGAGWISLRGWAPSGAHAVGSLAASERCLRPTTPSAMCTASV